MATVTTDWATILEADRDAASSHRSNALLQADPGNTANVNVRIIGNTEYVVLEAGSGYSVGADQLIRGIEAQAVSGTQTLHAVR